MQITSIPRFATLSLCLVAAAAHAGNTWGTVKYPSKPPTRVIGGYSNGCLRGAETLDWDGPGFHAVRTSRRRFYGHTDMTNYLRDLGRDTSSSRLGDILVSDLSQPRGGQMLNSSHKSHQHGLDVDVWYNVVAPGSPDFTDSQRESIAPDVLLYRYDGKGGINEKVWKKAHEQLIIAAASQANVARIFVNPHIKKKLCALYPGKENEAWLHKLRPEEGHHDHFHARLYCPPNSPQCVPQAEQPAGSGCGQNVDRWIGPDGTVRTPALRASESGDFDVQTTAAPKECSEVLSEADVAR